MIKTDNLYNKKNLLAFSGGTDSAALFFQLIKHNIKFDIAIVDYNLRDQSKKEVEYAKELANKFGIKIFIKEVFLNNESNLEKEARNIRHEFFKNIIVNDNYDNLLTGHHLNDRAEWLFMQLSKGAGLKEIIGMSYIDNVDGTYNIVRPFIDTTRDDINNYLLENNLKYFTDDSNFDIKYKRNYFRHNFVNEIVSKFSSGIRNSFKYLEKDYELIQKSDIIFQEKDFYIVSRTNDIMNIRKIDEIMKTKFKYLLSKEQREDIASDYNVVFNNISISANSDFIFIAPYITEYIMDKKFKEKMRLLKIPANVRQYIFKNNIDINAYCIHL